MNPAKPCHDCPFRRDIKPGTLGGSHFTVYIGQTVGPFVLNCHTAEGYRAKQTDCMAVAQCAGAAIFRANIGIAFLLPDALHALPADTDAVFGSMEEFIAHHEGWPLAVAEHFLERHPPDQWLARELSDPQAREL